MWMRPIRPTADAKVKIRKNRWPQTDYARRKPWQVLTMYGREQCYTLVGSFPSWHEAVEWCERG